MEPIRYGILSTSSIAPRFIAAVRDGEAGEICALSSRSLEKAREKCAEWNIPKAYGSHMELLEDPEIDTVYISNVNAQHEPWVRAALEHGKHVVCEKPMTTTSAETRALFALAREKGLFLMEAQKMLFLPVMDVVRQRIAAGELGKIQMVEFRHSFSAAYNNWMFDPALGGGTLLSSGIYVTSLLIWLLGPIARYTGVCSRRESGAEDQYFFSGEMECGALFSAANSTRAMLQDGARLYGEKGWVDLPNYWKARKAVFHLEGREPEIVEIPCQYEMVYEAKHVLECRQKGLLTSPVMTEELSVAAIEALERIQSHWI